MYKEPQMSTAYSKADIGSEKTDSTVKFKTIIPSETDTGVTDVDPNIKTKNIKSNIKKYKVGENMSLRKTPRHNCKDIQSYINRRVPHLPEGYSSQYHTIPKRIILSSEPNKLQQNMLKYAAYVRESLRPKLPPSSYKYNEVISDKQKLQSSPGPAAYNICIQSSSPSYTFGLKENTKNGGGRKCWARPFMRTSSPFLHKCDFERKWPTPFDYPQTASVGTRQFVKQTFPSHSMGKKFKEKHIEGSPAANFYFPELADSQVRKTAPSFTISSSPRNQKWFKSMNTPSPNTYNVSLKSKGPFYTISARTRS